MMTIYTYAYAPDESDHESTATEYALFCENLPLLLEHRQDILSCGEYFFCPLSFAWCSWLWIAGSGALCLGYLLLGWQQGILAEPCPACGETVHITSFGGSLLSGANWCYGWCLNCQASQKSKPASVSLKDRMDYVLAMRKQLPVEISCWEDYEGYIFSWGGNGLQPARKKRLVTKPVVETVSLEVVIEELRSGRIRRGRRPNVRVLEDSGYQLELRFENGGRLTAPVRLIQGNRDSLSDTR